MGGGAVGLDDESVGGPVEVDFVALDPVVHQRSRQAELRDEGKEPFLELASRDLRAVFQARERLKKGSGTAAG